MLFYLLSLIFSVINVQSAQIDDKINYYELTDSFKNEYVGNPDEDSIIVRPCQVYDLNCIRHFFADHAKCKIVNGPLPDPLIRNHNGVVYLPSVNITISQTNIVMYGFSNMNVEEFYFNKKTDKVVIALNVKNLRVVTRGIYLRYYRNGREPIVIRSSAIIFYPSVSFTLVIPNINDMKLDEAEVTTFVDASVNPVVVGPEVLSYPDPGVTRALAELGADPSTAIQELVLAEGNFPPQYYIQKNICDFGFLLL